jgi:hypothetical protein
MMLVMCMVMTIRTGRSAANSAAWFARVAATGLAQRHAPPEVACELAHFLWKWHRLIKIGQELTKHSSSCYLFSSPHHFLLHCITLPCPRERLGHLSIKEALAGRKSERLQHPRPYMKVAYGNDNDGDNVADKRG